MRKVILVLTLWSTAHATRPFQVIPQYSGLYASEVSCGCYSIEAQLGDEIDYITEYLTTEQLKGLTWPAEEQRQWL